MKRNIFIFVISIFFLGCQPDSINPITSSPENLLDDRLNGTWIAQDKSGSFQVNKLKDGMIEIITENENKYNTANYIIATIYNSNIQNNSYLSIQVHNIDDVKDGYIIAKYNFDDSKTLKFAYIDKPELRQLIKSKKIKGNVSRDLFYNTIITDTSENIKSIIAEYDSLLFKNYMIFNKVTITKGPSPSNIN